MGLFSLGLFSVKFRWLGKVIVYEVPLMLTVCEVQI